jgi:hypothetical protein
MVTFMIKYFIIQRMKKEGASHLPAPPAGCSCLDDGPIPTAPPKTSMVTNQYMCMQRKLVRCRLPIRERKLFHCRQLNFGSESQFHCRTHDSAANVNSLQPTQFRQRITNPLQNAPLGSECQFAADDIVSAANHNFTAEHTIRQ